MKPCREPMMRLVRFIGTLCIALALALPAGAGLPHRHKKGFKTPKSSNYHKVVKHHMPKHKLPKHPHHH